MSWPPRCANPACGHAPEEHGLIFDVGCHVPGCPCDGWYEEDDAEPQETAT